MTANVGTIDRLARAVLGFVLLYLAFFSGIPAFDAGVLKYAAAGIGVVMLVVAGSRFCPVYSTLGFKTCKV